MKAILKKTIYLILMILANIRLPVLSCYAQIGDKCEEREVTLPSACIYKTSFSYSKLRVNVTKCDDEMAAEHLIGDSLYICYNDEDYLYQDGKLYLHGTLQTGKMKGFLRHTLAAFDKINEGKEGASMILELENSKNRFLVVDGYGHFKTEDIHKAYANQIETDSSQMNIQLSVQRLKTDIKGGSGGIIYWSPAGTIMPTADGGVNSPTLDLAHEMFHGLDANRGLLDSRLHRGLARSEWQTVFRENMLRSQLSLPLRTHYGWNVDVEGNFVGGSGRSMISINNQPIVPFWYKL